MPMKMPKAAGEATALFEALRPSSPEVSVRLVFGQPAAFVSGNMFLGVFGDDVFLRLSETDRTEAARVTGSRPFEPMPGRPMREYVVLPAAFLGDRAKARDWIERSLGYARSLPAKGKAKPVSAPRTSRRPTPRKSG